MKAVALAVFALTAMHAEDRAGITLRLGENSSFRTTDAGIEIRTGTAFVTVDATKNSVTVICANAVTLSTPGVYRFDAGSKVCRLKVYQGAADVRLKTLNTPVRAGEMMNLSLACADMIPTLDFDPTDADRLDETGHFRSGWIVSNRRP